jgi:hypothetical protein
MSKHGKVPGMRKPKRKGELGYEDAVRVLQTLSDDKVRGLFMRHRNDEEAGPRLLSDMCKTEMGRRGIGV